MPRSTGRLLWISLVGLVLTAQAVAQGGATGAITGIVVDPSGAVVAGADVRIVDQDTGAVTRTVKTDANGSFTAPLLPVATYTVTVQNPGFAEGTFSDHSEETELVKVDYERRPNN